MLRRRHQLHYPGLALRVARLDSRLRSAEGKLRVETVSIKERPGGQHEITVTEPDGTRHRVFRSLNDQEVNKLLCSLATSYEQRLPDMAINLLARRYPKRVVSNVIITPSWMQVEYVGIIGPQAVYVRSSMREKWRGWLRPHVETNHLTPAQRQECEPIAA